MIIYEKNKRDIVYEQAVLDAICAVIWVEYTVRKFTGKTVKEYNKVVRRIHGGETM